METGLIGLSALFLLLALGVPIGFSMLAVGFFGLGMTLGFSQSLTIATNTLYFGGANWLYVCVPMFILMGNFTNESGIIRQIFDFFTIWLGRVPGALGVVTIATSALLAFATGSSVAATAVLGKTIMPEMQRYKYDRRFALGTIAAGGTLGNLIPPSIGLILFGVITGQSIGKLLMAAILPGIVVSALFIIAIIVMVTINKKIAPPTVGGTWKEKWQSFRGVWGMMVLIVAVLGGIFTGLATATEASCIGAFGAFLIIFVKGKFSLRGLASTLRDTAGTTAMIFFILIAVTLFSRFMALSGFTRSLGSLAVSHGMGSPVIILLLVLLTFFILGCLVDPTSLLLLIVPIVYPVMTAVGYDPIWFGVICVIMIEVSFLTPPVGLGVFVLKTVTNSTIEEIFASVTPFILMWFVLIALLTIFPSIALFLPQVMLGK